MNSLRRDQQLLAWAAAASVLLWLVPGARMLLAPLVYLNTHIHELCHALAGLLSGGSVDSIKVYRDFSGVAMVQGGSLPLVASAGYVGASIIGGILIMCGRKEDIARVGIWTLFGFLAFSMALFVRGDLVGVLTGLGWMAALLVMALKLKEHWAQFAVQFLGVQQCLNSLAAFLALIDVSLGAGHSDAKIMEQATGIPDVFWAGLWLVISGAITFFCLKRSWRDQKSQP